MEESHRKKLAILVGGGPAPGINSVIGAATIRSALEGGADRGGADDAVDSRRRAAADEDGKLLSVTLFHGLHAATRSAPITLPRRPGPGGSPWAFRSAPNGRCKARTCSQGLRRAREPRF